MKRVATGTDEARKLAESAGAMITMLQHMMPDVDVLDAAVYLTWVAARTKGIRIDTVVSALQEYERLNPRGVMS